LVRDQDDYGFAGIASRGRDELTKPFRSLFQNGFFSASGNAGAARWAGPYVAGHLLGGFPEAREISHVAKITRKKFYGLARLPGQFGRFSGADPLGKNLATLFDTDS
jgi:hypothetical protein